MSTKLRPGYYEDLEKKMHDEYRNKVSYENAKFWYAVSGVIVIGGIALKYYIDENNGTLNWIMDSSAMFSVITAGGIGSYKLVTNLWSTMSAVSSACSSLLNVFSKDIKKVYADIYSYDKQLCVLYILLVECKDILDIIKSESSNKTLVDKFDTLGEYANTPIIELNEFKKLMGEPGNTFEADIQNMEAKLKIHMIYETDINVNINLISNPSFYNTHSILFMKITDPKLVEDIRTKLKNDNYKDIGCVYNTLSWMGKSDKKLSTYFFKGRDDSGWVFDGNELTRLGKKPPIKIVLEYLIFANTNIIKPSSQSSSSQSSSSQSSSSQSSSSQSSSSQSSSSQSSSSQSSARRSHKP